jgi:hypothetical protein
MHDPKQTAYQPIAIGSTCEAKFQICRKLYASFYGKKSEAGFRVQMMPPERGRRHYGWHVFDWQRVPFANMLDWLEGDFERVLEREDLRIDGAFILHRTGTEHSHQFHGFTTDWTEEDLDRAYPAIRRNLDKCIVEFRQLLARPGPYLYVWTASYYDHTDFAPSPDQVRRLLDLLASGSPEHQFHLLIVANPGKGADYGGLEDRVTLAYRTDETDKNLTMAWEGNDVAWNAILEPFTLTMHDRETPAASLSQPPPPAEPEPAPAPRRGLLSRLLNR